MMRKIFFVVIFSIFSLIAVSPAFAQTVTPHPTPLPKAPAVPQETYSTAKVLAVLAQGVKTVEGQKSPYQKLRLQILNGSDTGKILTLTYGNVANISLHQEVSQGDTVVIMKTIAPHQPVSYEIVDTYRLNALYPVAILFLVVVLLVTRLKGLGSLIGLGISVTVILAFIVPQILAGQDPLRFPAHHVQMADQIHAHRTTCWPVGWFLSQSSISKPFDSFSLQVTAFTQKSISLFGRSGLLNRTI